MRKAVREVRVICAVCGANRGAKLETDAMPAHTKSGGLVAGEPKCAGGGQAPAKALLTEVDYL